MYQKPCVFEGPNAELREGSLISDHKTLNFDRGLKFEKKMNTPPDPPDPLDGVRLRAYSWLRAPESGFRQF